MLTVFAFVMLVVLDGFSSRDDLSASNPAPSGAQAVARVLADHGVTVDETTTLAQTRAAATDPDTTVLVYDPSQLLDSEHLAQLGQVRGDVVLVQPDYLTLETLAPEVLPSGSVQGTLAAQCDLPAAVDAGTITADGLGYRVPDESISGVSRCFGSGDGVYSVVVAPHDNRTITVLGSTDVLANSTITREGNAALALGLLGGHHRLVWYLPSVDDLTPGAPELGALTPTWFVPLVVLGLLLVVLAGVWRGRRLGPLVVERLPVVVRSSETMEGRARLYAKNSSRVHALDALRVGELSRLASLCGLPRIATVDDVVAAVADVLGRDAAGIRSLLVGALPSSDAELVRMSDDLNRLEADVRAVLRPDTPRPAPEG